MYGSFGFLGMLNVSWVTSNKGKGTLAAKKHDVKIQKNDGSARLTPLHERVCQASSFSIQPISKVPYM